MRTPSTIVLAATLLACAALVAACGGDDDAGDESTAASGAVPTADELDGRSFTAADVDGHDLVEGSSVVIRFQGDGLSVEAGCNSMRGGYSIEDGALVVGPLAATMMACEQALMDQDTWMQQFLEGGPAITLDDQLQLADDQTTITFDET